MLDIPGIFVVAFVFCFVEFISLYLLGSLLRLLDDKREKEMLSKQQNHQ